MIPGKTLDIMQAEIERRGGSVANKRIFKGLIRIKMTKVEDFIEELNQELMKSN
ncbi:MAG: hypothetical protein HWN79_06360 [Candidatus Lokiarchaeota archaeon]|nr:hypothetical protein [Candidatus Lokiarchaeota archaeon]